jgi:ribosomal protein L11 methyltransferase
MNWLQVTIFTTSQGIEPVSGRLYLLGITGIEIEDENEFNEFLENNKQYWDYVDDELREKMKGETRIKAYVSDNASGNEMLLAIKDSMSSFKELDANNIFGRLETSLASISEQDWAENWKKYFKPIKIGKKILIKPEWEPLPHDTESRIVFHIEPGMVFGTGTHESTQLCIEASERFVKQGDKVLDLGCGSGILSIIALLLGADSAVAVDIDPNAINIAYANAEMNGISKDKYTVLAGNVVTDNKIKQQIGGGYDVVFANIVAEVIIALAPFVPIQLKKDGILIASGIIDECKYDVINALTASGFEIVEINENKGWVGLVCRKINNHPVES